MKRVQTMAEDINESTNAKMRVIHEGATCAYWIEAMAAAVIGNVYAHHAIENLKPRKKLMRTMRDV